MIINERLRNINKMNSKEVFEAAEFMANESGIELVDVAVSTSIPKVCAVFIKNCDENGECRFRVKTMMYFFGLADIHGNKYGVKDSGTNIGCPHIIVCRADIEKRKQVALDDISFLSSGTVDWMSGGVVNE